MVHRPLSADVSRSKSSPHYALDQLGPPNSASIEARSGLKVTQRRRPARSSPTESRADSSPLGLSTDLFRGL